MTSEDRPSKRARAGRWLREQRERQGFSSAAGFGRAIGTTKEVVWSYEAGRSSVPDERAAQIAEVLGIDVIEVRRNLGLWVPDRPQLTSVPTGDERLDKIERGVDAVAEAVAELQAEVRELREGRREAR